MDDKTKKAAVTLAAAGALASSAQAAWPSSGAGGTFSFNPVTAMENGVKSMQDKDVFAHPFGYTNNNFVALAPQETNIPPQNALYMQVEKGELKGAFVPVPANIKPDNAPQNVFALSESGQSISTVASGITIGASGGVLIGGKGFDGQPGYTKIGVLGSGDKPDKNFHDFITRMTKDGILNDIAADPDTKKALEADATYATKNRADVEEGIATSKKDPNYLKPVNVPGAVPPAYDAGWAAKYQQQQAAAAAQSPSTNTPSR